MVYQIRWPGKRIKKIGGLSPQASALSGAAGAEQYPLQTARPAALTSVMNDLRLPAQRIQRPGPYTPPATTEALGAPPPRTPTQLNPPIMREPTPMPLPGPEPAQGFIQVGPEWPYDPIKNPQGYGASAQVAPPGVGGAQPPMTSWPPSSGLPGVNVPSTGGTIPVGVAGGYPQFALPLTPEQQALQTALADYMKGRIGQGLAPYDFEGAPGAGAMAGALGTALAGQPSTTISPETTEQYYEESIRAPALRRWGEETKPELRETYRGPGTFWGGQRAIAEERSKRDLEAELRTQRAKLMYEDVQAQRGLAESAAGRQQAAVPQAQALLQSYYQDFMRTQPEASPVLEQALNLLGMPLTGVWWRAPGSAGMDDVLANALKALQAGQQPPAGGAPGGQPPAGGGAPGGQPPAAGGGAQPPAGGQTPEGGQFLPPAGSRPSGLNQVTAPDGSVWEQSPTGAGWRMVRPPPTPPTGTQPPAGGGVGAQPEAGTAGAGETRDTPPEGARFIDDNTAVGQDGRVWHYAGGVWNTTGETEAPQQPGAGGVGEAPAGSILDENNRPLRPLADARFISWLYELGLNNDQVTRFIDWAKAKAGDVTLAQLYEILPGNVADEVASRLTGERPRYAPGGI